MNVAGRYESVAERYVTLQSIAGHYRTVTEYIDFAHT